MATKTSINLTVNLQSGHVFIPAGNHTLPDSPYSDILQAEINAKAPHVVVLGTAEVPDADVTPETDGDTPPLAAPSAPRTGGRRRAAQ